MICVPCLQGMPEFCMSGGECESIPSTNVASELSDEEDSTSRFTKTRQRKRVATLKDPLSTGRKEAARLYPFLKKDGSVWVKGDSKLDRAECEWAWLEKAGGGDHPIRGCGLRGEPEIMQARHHGPDKNTMNNEPDNVHRIGHNCHNRWHAANDAEYDWNNRSED